MGCIYVGIVMHELMHAVGFWVYYYYYYSFVVCLCTFKIIDRHFGFY
jgi:hypothetical protein